MADIDRVNNVLGQITAEQLDMGHWGQVEGSVPMGCGTTMCFAGHACVAAGKQLNWEPEYDERWNEKAGEWEDVLVGYNAVDTTDGEQIEYFAKQWLGLTAEEADRIFYATEIKNDVTLLRDHVDTVLNRPEERSKVEDRMSRRAGVYS